MHEEIEKLYTLYYNDLYWYILKLSSNNDIVDDIIQNTFLEAFKSIESFNGKSSIKTWLFSIAKYQVYRYFRKNKLHIDIDDISEIEICAEAENDISDKVFAGEIFEAINALSPPINEIMGLRIIHGLSFKEIGKRVGKTENYCRVNFYRVKEKLRKGYYYE